MKKFRASISGIWIHNLCDTSSIVCQLGYVWLHIKIAQIGNFPGKIVLLLEINYTSILLG